MKIIFLVMSFFFISKIAKAQKVNEEGNFLILNIDSSKNIYTIYAKRNDSTFKIVSHKGKRKMCKNIFQGEYYPLVLSSFLEGTASKLHIGRVKFQGEYIPLEGDGVIWDLFYCRNLNGLCFMDKHCK